MDAAEAVGHNIMDLVVPESERRRGQEIIAAVESTGYWEGDWILRRKDGTTFPALVFNKSLTDVPGQPGGFVFVAIDNTERRRLEEYTEQARQRVVACKLAGGVAHDFNNLLTVINGNAELALARLPPSDALLDVVQISRSADLAVLLDALLLVSRQEFRRRSYWT